MTPLHGSVSLSPVGEEVVEKAVPKEPLAKGAGGLECLYVLEEGREEVEEEVLAWDWLLVVGMTVWE